MEFLVVALVLTIAVVAATGNYVWIWLGILAAASWVGFKAYRIRCPQCHQKALTGRQMKFCNQCGAEQSASRRGWRLKCEVCKRLNRSELNLQFCNCCGFRLPAQN